MSRLRREVAAGRGGTRPEGPARGTSDDRPTAGPGRRRRPAPGRSGRRLSSRRRRPLLPGFTSGRSVVPGLPAQESPMAGNTRPPVRRLVRSSSGPADLATPTLRLTRPPSATSPRSAGPPRAPYGLGSARRRKACPTRRVVRRARLGAPGLGHQLSGDSRRSAGRPQRRCRAHHRATSGRSARDALPRLSDFGDDARTTGRHRRRTRAARPRPQGPPATTWPRRGRAPFRVTEADTVCLREVEPPPV